MKSKVIAVAGLLVGLLAVCGSTWAHHGSAVYETTKVVVLKDATVTKFIWANPHCILMFDAKGENGNVAHWAAEAGSPSALTLIGWTKIYGLALITIRGNPKLISSSPTTKVSSIMPRCAASG